MKNKSPFLNNFEKSLNKALRDSKGDNNPRYGGVGFTGLLTIALIVLKLTGVIAWSWWWVLSPIWIPLALVVGVISVVLIIVFAVLITKGGN